jgi:phosphoribosyl-ATP pyrophosphohydrolase
MTDSIQRLHLAVCSRRHRDPTVSRTAKLLKAGSSKVAKKVAEEAAEVALEAATGNRREVIRESADLLYHLVVLWVEVGVSPRDVWSEMDRRERLLGIAEKPPKGGAPARTIPLERARQRRGR